MKLSKLIRKVTDPYGVKGIHKYTIGRLGREIKVNKLEVESLELQLQISKLRRALKEYSDD